jgi:purine nucleosidase
MPRPAVLDTDIGSDVDDILALVLLARIPDVHLLGVTTVYGDTHLRARMARHVLDLLGLPDVPVLPGAEATRTGRPVWWAGWEGEGLPDLAHVVLPPGPDAVSFLTQAARDRAGQLELFAIGPLTNVAAAIAADPDFVRAVRRCYVMGGAFWRDEAEHNIKSDPEAADVVFRSGLPITICGLDVTTRVTLGEREVRAIGAAPAPIGPLLADQIRRYWASTKHTGNAPHDPLAILMAPHPELFRFEACDVRVGLTAADLGRTLIDACGRGAVQIAAEADVPAVTERLLAYLAPAD